MPLSRVVITGLGVISPLGLSGDALWASLCQHRSGAVAMPPGLPLAYAASCQEFTGAFDQFLSSNDETRRLLRKGIKLMSREIQMAVAVAGYAMRDAQLAPHDYAPQRIGVSFGCDYILTTPDELLESVKACIKPDSQFDFAKWVDSGMPLMTPLWQLKYLTNMPSSHIAIYNNLQGPSNSITLREASIGGVMGESMEIIRSGRADAMLVGTTGSRTQLSKMIQSVQQETVAADGVCRPFDAERNGTLLGEGAGAMLLESEESAVRRGATIYGEVFSACSLAECVRDARNNNNIAATSSSLLSRVMATTLERAKIGATKLGHISAHGLGDVQSDAAEAAAISNVVGTKVPVTTIKGHCGLLGAGSGAVEVIASLLALRAGHLFPICNHTHTASDCPIHAVTTDDVTSGDSFLKLAFNHQGQASAVLVRKYV